MNMLNRKSLYIFIIYTLFFLLYLPSFSESRDIRKTILDNGLEIVTLEDHRAPIFVFQIWYRVGARNEEIGKTGVSHLLEHMMFKGTERYPKGELSRIVARNGGNENAFTSEDYTAYFEKLSSDRLYLSLELESDRMVNLILDPAEVLLERDVVAEERRLRTEDDPSSQLIEEMNAMAFKVHPYRSPVIGWMNDIRSLTRDDLYTYYKTYYIPNNAIIVVVGDFDTEEIISGIKRYFGKIPGGKDPPSLNVIEPEQMGERRVYLQKEAEIPYIFIGYHTPNFKDPDVYPLEVLSNILFSGKSSRLYKNLVYEKEAALFADGGYENLKVDPGLFSIYVGLRPGRGIEEVEEMIYQELEEIRKGAVSDKELQKAKNQIEAEFIFSQDSLFYQAMLIGIAETIGAGYEYLDKFADNIRNVTIEDIRRVTEKYLVKRNRTVGILIPEKRKE
ncbi:MAG: M16 family metallopeptidase [Nitrospinota bacterium]